MRQDKRPRCITECHGGAERIKRLIQCPVGLATDGVHAMLTSRLWCSMVSDRAACQYYRLARLLPGACLTVSTMSWAPRSRYEPQIRVPEPGGEEQPLLFRVVRYLPVARR